MSENIMYKNIANKMKKQKDDNMKSHQINYNYFKCLYSKAEKDIVIDDLTYKCEDLDNLKKSYYSQEIELQNYKSRCEKAIEYIEDVMELTKECPQDLLNILNGRSDK